MKVLQYRRRAPNLSPFTVFVIWTIVRHLVFVLFRLMYRLRYTGQTNIPSQGPVIYIANHQSNLDPPAIGCLIWDRPFIALARVGLFKFKPFAWAIRLTGAIPLRRGRGDAQAIRAAIDQLNAGGCVLMFPEGTRSTDGTVRPFKAGVLVLVKRTKAPVVPLAVEGAYDIWPIGQRFPRLRGRIKVQAGRAIPADELLADAPDKTLQRLRCEIDAMRMDLCRQLREATKGRYPPPGPADVQCAQTST